MPKAQYSPKEIFDQRMLHEFFGEVMKNNPTKEGYLATLQKAAPAFQAYFIYEASMFYESKRSPAM